MDQRRIAIAAVTLDYLRFVDKHKTDVGCGGPGDVQELRQATLNAHFVTRSGDTLELTQQGRELLREGDVGRGMPHDLGPASADEVAAALAHRLTRVGRRAWHRADEIVPAIVVGEVVDALHAAGFVVMRNGG